MARKPHLAAMLDHELDDYGDALALEMAAVLVEKELRYVMERKTKAERDRDQLQLPWEEPDQAA